MHQSVPFSVKQPNFSWHVNQNHQWLEAISYWLLPISYYQGNRRELRCCGGGERGRWTWSIHIDPVVACCWTPDNRLHRSGKRTGYLPTNLILWLCVCFIRHVHEFILPGWSVGVRIHKNIWSLRTRRFWFIECRRWVLWETFHHKRS